MYYLLFFIYLGIGAYLVPRIPFIKKTGLDAKIIVLLFIVKVFAGLALGWITQKFYPGNDYWIMNMRSMDEYNTLVSDPKEFVANIFRSPYEHGYSGYFNAIGSYWNDLRYNIILKLMAFCDIFSRGNYYINSLILNFIGFFGPVALFRVFNDIYKNRKWAIIAGCFLLPSTLYFSSGIFKDLFVFTLLGLFCYSLYFSVYRPLSMKRLMLLFLSLAGILLIRNYVFFLLIPATIAFLISAKSKFNPFLIFISTYGIILILIFILEMIIPSFQPLKIITHRQSDFLNIPTAATQLNTPVLDPTLGSFLKNIPVALDHAILKPSVWKLQTQSLLPIALEFLAYEILFVFALYKYRSQLKSPNPFILFALFFAFTMLLITGFIIPNSGSIVRYRSIYLPLLLTPLFSLIPIKSR